MFFAFETQFDMVIEYYMNYCLLFHSILDLGNNKKIQYLLFLFHSVK